jgi:hypothetical protein
MATFADDATAMAVGETAENGTRKLQSAVNKVAIWTKNADKNSTNPNRYILTTNKKIRQQPIFINGIQIPYANSAKYLGMTLDAKLRWKEHIKKKRELYVIRPVCSYGIQLWGCASDSNIEVIQRYQNKVLSVLSTHHGTFGIVTIVISESRWLQISSLSSPTLMETYFKTTSTSKCPDF